MTLGKYFVLETSEGLTVSGFFLDMAMLLFSNS